MKNGDLSRVEVPRCPVCGGERSDQWLYALGFDLRRCGGCGHRYADSVLSSERLSHQYYDEPDADIRNRSLSAKRRRFEEYVSYFPDVFARRGRVLDIGCNAGELLALFHSRGWSIAGIEVSPGPAGYARRTLGAPVHIGTLDSFARPPAPFDLVTMVHVLEHLRDPARELARARDLLGPGGSLLVEVPNADDMLITCFRGFYRPLCPGDHVSFFDRTTLCDVLKRAGFVVQAVHSPMWARDVVYGSLLSALDFLRTRGGRRLSGSGGVEAQLRYRGRLRRSSLSVLDALVETVDPFVFEATARVGNGRGAALIALAVPA